MKDPNGLDAYYVIDSGTSDTSFIATPATIDASGEVRVSDPTNFIENVGYKIIYESPSFVPQLGLVKIVFPNEIQFDTAVTLTSGFCQESWVCTWVDDQPQK